ncbi:MAG: hypothetical protein ABIK60_01535 [candidate division WOR-3 bacterium]
MKFYLTDEEKKKIRDLGIFKVSQVAYFFRSKSYQGKEDKERRAFPFNTFKILWN